MISITQKTVQYLWFMCPYWGDVTTLVLFMYCWLDLFTLSCECLLSYLLSCCSLPVPNANTGSSNSLDTVSKNVTKFVHLGYFPVLFSDGTASFLHMPSIWKGCLETHFTIQHRESISSNMSIAFNISIHALTSSEKHCSADPLLGWI